MASPAFAYLINPSSISIPDVKVFRNLAETGDCLYVFSYDIEIPSDNYSTTPASDSIIFRLYDTDNTTVKAVATPYVYPYFESNGYADGISSFYFGASDNASVWGSDLQIEVYGWPSFYSPTISEKFPITSSDYVLVTTQETNRSLLKDFVLLLADRLAADYQDTGVILKSTSDSGIVLSSYGEMYFRGAIDGLDALCPELFFIQVVVPEVMEVEPYDTSLADTLRAAHYTGGDMERGFNRIGDVIGVSGDVAVAILFFGLSLGLCIWTTRKGWGVEVGLGLSALVGTLSAVLVGSILFTILMCVSFVAVGGIVYLTLLKRA